MNSKLCKNLRRAARQLTTGMPYRRYIAMSTGNVTTVKNDPTTTRAVYRRLKKEARIT